MIDLFWQKPLFREELCFPEIWEKVSKMGENYFFLTSVTEFGIECIQMMSSINLRKLQEMSGS